MSMSCSMLPAGLPGTTYGAVALATPAAVASTPVASTAISGGATTSLDQALAGLQAVVRQLQSLVAQLGGQGAAKGATTGAATIDAAGAMGGGASALVAPESSSVDTTATQQSAAVTPVPDQPAAVDAPAANSPAADPQSAADQAAAGASALGANSVAPLADLVQDQMSADHGGSSACGPTAAAAFARFLGTNESVSDAVHVAEDAGLWNADDGMGGYQTEVQLLGKLGVKAHATDVDWNKVRKTVQSGTPVILATGKHYWVAEQYDPKTGRFNFGKSGSVFKNEDRTWYTPQEMQGHGPAAQHAIYLDGTA